MKVPSAHGYRRHGRDTEAPSRRTTQARPSCAVIRERIRPTHAVEDHGDELWRVPGTLATAENVDKDTNAEAIRGSYRACSDKLSTTRRVAFAGRLSNVIFLNGCAG